MLKHYFEKYSKKAGDIFSVEKCMIAKGSQLEVCCCCCCCVGLFSCLFILLTHGSMYL